MKINLQNSFTKLFVISLLWLLIEGVLRKWIFFSLAGPLFYVKYLLFSFLYLVFLFSKQPLVKLNHPYQIFILFFITTCFISFLVTSTTNPAIVGIIGLVVHLMFIPLTHLTQFLFKNLNAINRFIKIFTITTFPICILGMIQFYLPTDHPINGFVNEDQLTARVGGFTRISSVFPFVKLYNAYLLFGVTLLTGVILNRLLKSKSTILEIVSLFLMIANTFMSGSRLPIGLMLFNFCFLSVYVFINFSNLRKTVVVTLLLGLVGLSFLYITTDILKDPIDASISRFEKVESRHRTESTGYTDIQLRVEDRLDIFKFSDKAGWFGYGIGMAYQGSQGFIRKPIPFYFEEEGERIVLELGILGGIATILMRLAFFIFSFQILKWCKSVEIKLLILPLLLYILPGIFTLQNITFSYLENFIYYFVIGLIIALYKIQQKEITT